MALLESGVEPVVVGLAMGLLDVRVPGRAVDLERATRAVPRVPRAADAGARALGRRRAAGRDLAERAAAAPSPPVDELRDRAAVRARERRDRDRRRRARARVHLADHARRSSSATSSASRVGILGGSWLVTRLEPRPAAAAGRLGGGRGRRHDRRDRVHGLAADRDARVRRRTSSRRRSSASSSAALGASLVTWLLFRATALLPKRPAGARAPRRGRAARRPRRRGRPRSATTSAGRSTRRSRSSSTATSSARTAARPSRSSASCCATSATSATSGGTCR